MSEAPGRTRQLSTPFCSVRRPRRVALDRGAPKRLGESWQRTAVFRPSGTFACVSTDHHEGQALPDGKVYCLGCVPIF